MMNLIRFYNKNRHAIWITIVVIILIFGVMKTLNNLSKNNAKDKSSSTNNSTTTYNKNNYSIISGTNMPNEVTSQSTNIIDNFIKYCNEKDISSAYNLLSNDCKETLYLTEEEFKNNYVNKIFSSYKMYDKRAWINTNSSYTYSIKITEDLLSTGGNKEDMSIQDYYTLVKENGEYKLNINNYIGKEEINKTKAENGIEVYVIEKKTYIDYEIYTIKVKNNTQNEVILDSKEDTKTVYLTDTNNYNYVAFLNELSLDDITIKSGMTQTIKIKFNKSYNPKNVEKSIVFTNIILNYQEYLNNKNNQFTQIEVEI